MSRCTFGPEADTYLLGRDMRRGVVNGEPHFDSAWDERSYTSVIPFTVPYRLYCVSARETIHGAPDSTSCLGSAKPVRKVPFSQLFKRVGKPAWPIVHLFLSSERAS